MRVAITIDDLMRDGDEYIVFGHENQILARNVAMAFANYNTNASPFSYTYRQEDMGIYRLYKYGYPKSSVTTPWFQEEFLDYLVTEVGEDDRPYFYGITSAEDYMRSEWFDGSVMADARPTDGIETFDDWAYIRNLSQRASAPTTPSSEQVFTARTQQLRQAITRLSSQPSVRFGGNTYTFSTNMGEWLLCDDEQTTPRDEAPQQREDDVSSHSCRHCWSSATRKIGGYYYCDNCYKQRVRRCAICGEEHFCDGSENSTIEFHIFNGRAVCDKCMKSYIKRYKKSVYFCTVCGEYHSVDFYGKNRVNENEWCCDWGKTNCNKCHCCEMLVYFNGNQNSYMHTSFNHNNYCHKCWLKKEKYLIKAYHNDPTPEFYIIDPSNEVKPNVKLELPPPDGRGSWYGLELEVDSGGQSDDVSEPTIKMLNDEVYAMRDGSLENGFEIVTHPHSESALYNLDWEGTFDFLVKKGYRSHDINTCGLHLHINRSVFGENTDEQRLNIAKLMYFFENNRAGFIKLSRREIQHINRWARFYFSQGIGTPHIGNYLTIYDKYNRSRNHDDRYMAVNLCKKNTIEFRLMRGTLNIDTFLATIDVLITISKNARKINLTREELNSPIKQERILDPALWLKGIKGDTMKYLLENDIFTKSVKELEGGDK